MKAFICTYTNRVKDYCDTEFLDNVHKLSKDNPVMIVDNTLDGSYTPRLETLTHAYPNFNINWIIVPRDPIQSQFQRNVTQSANLCRDAFLRSDADYMIIIESDVIPPVDLLDKLQADIEHLDQFAGKEWGIIGAHYYKGFHNYDQKGLYEVSHVLSGCTLYKRSVITKHQFRYNPEDLGPFPDAHISIDAISEYSLWNDGSIICEHIEVSPGNRQSHRL